MISNFFTYKVDKLPIPYKTPNGITYKQTIAITFLNKNNEEIYYLELGYIPTFEIYEKIFNKEPVNLDYCYIENFSLTAYRKVYELDKNSVIDITSFSSKNAIFDALISNDFSYVYFKDGNVIFENTAFIKGNVNFSYSTFEEGNKNFSYLFVKEGNLNFFATNFGNGNVSFKNAVFLHGIKNFKDCVFGEGERNFNNVEFGSGNVLFIHTTFNEGKVLFKIARFGDGIVDFHYSKFVKGDVSFERTEFGNGNVDFSKIEFGNGRINFNRAIFVGDNISFEGADLKSGRLIAKKTEFGSGNLNFEALNFPNANLILDSANVQDCKISFNNATIKELSFEGCNFNKYIDMRVKKCHSINLKDTTVRDIIDLLPHDNDLDILALNFSGIRLLGILLVEWKRNNLFELISTQKNSSIIQKAEQFRTLKKNFSDTGRYNDEDAAYVEFKRYEARARLQQAKKDKSIKKFGYYFVHFLQWLVFDKIGQYATNPIRVLTSMFFIYATFASTYAIILWLKWGDIVSGIGGTHAQIGIIAKSFFFGAITFLTIGYGDFYPMGAIRVLSGIEGFIGVFMMSYFTVAFVRKILR